MISNSEKDTASEPSADQAKSETPRTDRAKRQGFLATISWIEIGFARGLERELNAANGKMLEMADDLLRLKRKLSRLEAMK